MLIVWVVLLMPFAVANDGSTLEMNSTDNWASLQAFVDESEHTSVVLPPGNWPISQTLNLGLLFTNDNSTLRGYGVEATNLILYTQFPGPVLGIAGGGTWQGSETYVGYDFRTISGMTLTQMSNVSMQCKCLYLNAGNDFLGENLRFVGSSYEGAVGSSASKRVTLRNIEAWDCGNGGPAYAQATAGINFTCIDLLIEDFVTLRCGQGVETGNTRVTLRRGLVTSAGAGLPSVGVNIGSSVFGVWRTTVEDVTISGYDAGVICGSGNGRLAGVYFRRLKIYDDGVGGTSPITFYGGALNNAVPHPDQGPTTEGSIIEDCELHLTTPHNGAIGYNSGVADNNGLYGREPLIMRRNRIYMDLDDPSEQDAPILFVAGEVSAAVEMSDNHIYGLPAAPSRGDIATFTNVLNPVVPNMPTLSIRGNVAWDLNGRSRPFSIKKEA